MKCSLGNSFKETATHWVGCTGKEYPKNKYINHGRGGIYRELIDLPHDEYPYTIKYHVERIWKFCETCNCENKLK